MKKLKIKNLEKAREGLMGLDPEMLQMDRYRKTADGRAVDFKNKNHCGTFGCALGWCPFVKGLDPIDTDFKEHSDGRKYLDFGVYSQRLFNMDGSDKVWDYLFDSQWQEVDNTVEGLIKRMTRVIEGKKITDKDLAHNQKKTE